MLKNLYLAGAVAAVLAVAALLPRLVEEGKHSSFLTAILFDPGPKLVDRLQVGSADETAAQE